MCEGLSKRFNIASGEEYRHIVHQLIGMVNRNALLLVQADSPLEHVRNHPWPGDSLSHRFRCTACGRGFRLYADTYHGGANWEPDGMKSRIVGSP
jgi:hypothetical protein